MPEKNTSFLKDWGRAPVSTSMKQRSSTGLTQRVLQKPSRQFVLLDRKPISRSVLLRAAGMFLLILSCLSTAVAGESVRQVTRRAEQGDASAQYRLGRIYERGKGVNENYHRALHWYRKAANANMAEAQYSVGRMYAD